MLTGDGWLVRVKPPLGVLRAEILPAFAAACARHGNGTVEITSRAAIQVRGLTEDSVAPFASAMAELGLATPNERRRVVTVAPMLGGAVAEMVAEIEAALPLLPPKMFVALDGGALPIGDIGADFYLRPGDGVPALVEAVQAFLRLDPPPRRRRGARVAVPEVIGRHPTGLVAGVPFGELRADTLVELAKLSGDGTLRPTPWRGIVLPGTQDAAGLERLGLIVDPADPRLRVSACPGGPACASGSVPARADAAALRPSRTVHVSGCAKGCAHPGTAPVTLVGNDGRYNVVFGGRAGDTPSRRGLTFAEAAAL